MMESLYTSVRVRLFLSDCTAAKTNELGVVSMLQAVLLFALGLVLLIKGGDWFVDGATGLARRFKLPDIIVGATVVSIGTTLPEVMVSVTGALQGQGAMAYGNAIGSIICNTSLIAAISVACTPGPVNVKTMKMPVIFFFCSAALYCVAAYFLGEFPQWLGFVLLAIFAVYMFITVRQGMKNPDEVEEEEGEAKERPFWMELALLVVGAAVIAVGADLLVDNGTFIAKELGVPETVIAPACPSWSPPSPPCARAMPPWASATSSARTSSTSCWCPVLPLRWLPSPCRLATCCSASTLLWCWICP